MVCFGPCLQILERDMTVNQIKETYAKFLSVINTPGALHFSIHKFGVLTHSLTTGHVKSKENILDNGRRAFVRGVAFIRGNMV